MHKILVIGASGQLASELIYLKKNYPKFEFRFTAQLETDISNRDAVKSIVEKVQPEYIINCAAYTAVDKAETDSDRAYAINEAGAKNLAEIAKEFNAFLIHISTDFVFDGTNTNPYIESDTVNPISVYGASKLKGEQAIQATNGDYTIIRTSWLYSSFGANFVKTMLRLGTEKESLNVVSDQIGSPTYCRDLAEFILKNIDNFKAHNQQIYHFSNLGIASWYEFAAEIMKLANLKCQVSPIPTSGYPTPAARPAYSVMDKSKLMTDFNYQIPDWKLSLEKCIGLLQS
jgi:dTDP-4-dehydrorhamnose reductase